MRIQAKLGLSLALADGALRVGYGELDWLGPLSLIAPGAPGEALEAPSTRVEVGRDARGPFERVDLGGFRAEGELRASARVYPEQPLLVLRLEARTSLDRLSTGVFERPAVAWQLRPDLRAAGGLPEGSVAFGYQYMEFAFPTFSGPDLCEFFLVPDPPRPAVVEPVLLIAPDGRTLLLAPLDHFHEQVIAVPRGRERASDGVRLGWHGDLAEVPSGFATEVAIWAGTGPRATLEAWGSDLRERYRTRRPSRYVDASVGALSYWTDNGAAYWYRTEPELDVAETLARTLDELRARDVPIGSVQLDSWFYPHEKSRPVGSHTPERVPPTGMLAWEPRDDVIPQGVAALRERLGRPPLVLHSRHFSAQSPYFADATSAWLDADRGHPSSPELLERLVAQAATWGAIQYEQDWMVESFLGVRGLRERPGRARAWQQTLDRAASEHGLSLMWCMATPADFFQSVELENVAAIRTSGDYKYLIGSGALWAWYLYTNALARALGLVAFKDVFLSSREGTGRDGDPHAEAEALLAVLGAGPVGIGDRLGHTDPEVVMRTCRADGVLLKPDVPAAAIDRCFRTHVQRDPEPLVAETYSEHTLGRFVYVVALHAWRGDAPLRVELPLGDLGASAPDVECLAYDWRAQTAAPVAPDARLTDDLGAGAWSYRVLCPIAPTGLAVIGDPDRYVTAADRRLRSLRATDRGVAFDVLGAADESVRVRLWAASGCRAISLPRGARLEPVASGLHDLTVGVGHRGWQPVEIAPA